MFFYHLLSVVIVKSMGFMNAPTVSSVNIFIDLNVQFLRIFVAMKYDNCVFIQLVILKNETAPRKCLNLIIIIIIILFI